MTLRIAATTDAQNYCFESRENKSNQSGICASVVLHLGYVVLWARRVTNTLSFQTICTF